MRYSYNTLLMSLSAFLNICLFCVSFLGGFWLSDFSPYYGSCFSPYLHVWSYLIGCWTMFNFFLGAAYFFLQIFLTFALEYSSVYLDAVWYFSGLALILWPRAVLSLKFIIPHYWGKIFLSTQCPMTYEFSVWLVGTGTVSSPVWGQGTLPFHPFRSFQSSFLNRGQSPSMHTVTSTC